MAQDSSRDEHGDEQGDEYRQAGGPAARPAAAAPVRVAARDETTMPSDPTEGTPPDAGLHASEGLFRTIVEQAAAGVSLATVDGRLVYANQYLGALLGYARDELVGMNFRTLTHPDDVAGDEPLIAALLAGEVPGYMREKRHVAKDGTIRWVSLNVSLIRDAMGQPEYLLGVLHDISPRIALEQAVAGHAAQLDAIFGAVADMVVVYNREGHIVRANPAVERVLGLDSLVEYLQLPLDERASLIEMRDISGRALAPEELPAPRIMRGEMLEGAAADDLLVNTLDGRDVVLNWSGAPIFDGDGRAVGAVCIYRDVTERRVLEHRTRQALTALLAMAEAVVQPADAAGDTAPETAEMTARRLAELTQSVLGSERVSLVTLDPATGLLHARAIVGLSVQEQQAWRARVEGSPPEAHATPDELRLLRAGEPLIVDPAHPPSHDLPYTRPGHSLLDVPMRLGDATIGALTVDFGQGRVLAAEELEVALAVGRLAALMIDRAQLVREREAARANALAWHEASRRMDEFIGLASHELRTPLTTIKANLQLAERRLNRMAADETRREGPLARQIADLRAMLERMLVAAGRQERLTRDLLDASHIHEGKLALRVAWMDLGALVREESDDLRLRQPARVLSVTLPDAPLYVMADRDRLAQVLSGYLDNALKYSREGQPIAVSVGVRDGMARVDVCDHGPGVAADERRRIWERFYRAPGTEHASGSELGLGVGLYIGREIVERHGGRVGVVDAPDGGACFWFALPLGGHSPTA